MPGERNLADLKWARIAADYGGTCVWYPDGCGTCIEELPIDRGLQAALDGWCVWHNADCEDYAPPQIKEGKRFDIRAHREAGLILARAVKAQLPDWTIIFGWPREQIEIADGG